MYLNRLNKRLLGCLLISACIALTGCEVPSKPDFSIEHKIQVPLMTKQLPFLGGANALVDTNRSGLLHIFDVKDDGVVRITTLTSYAQAVRINGLPKLPPGVSYPKGMMINLGYDDPSNGVDTLDLFNDQEAKVNDFKDLKYFSERVGSFSLVNASFHLFYRTNLPVGNDIFAGLVGVDPHNNQTFLKSIPNTAYAVDSTDSISGLWAHNKSLTDPQILKFPIQKSEISGDTLKGVVSFDQSNSNLGNFIANIPTQVRFIGKAEINNPVLTDNGSDIYFDTAIGLDIPLEIATPDKPASYLDTVSVDFSGLPSPQDKSKISEGEIKIYYVNKLPLSAQMNFQLLNELKQPISTVIPDTTAGLSKALLDPAQIDGSTRFSAEPARGVMTVQLTGDQINMLNQTKYMVIKALLQTTQKQPVRLQATDYIRMTMSGNFTINSNVNNKNAGN